MQVRPTLRVGRVVPFDGDRELDTPILRAPVLPVNRIFINQRNTWSRCVSPNNGSTTGSNGETTVKKYLISYDLDKPGQDYTKLISELERLGAIKILYSEWILKNQASAAQLRDHLKAFIDSNDMLLVVALTGEAAWTSLMVADNRFKQSIAA